MDTTFHTRIPGDPTDEVLEVARVDLAHKMSSRMAEQLLNHCEILKFYHWTDDGISNYLVKSKLSLYPNDQEVTARDAMKDLSPQIVESKQAAYDDVLPEPKPKARKKK